MRPAQSTWSFSSSGIAEVLQPSETQVSTIKNEYHQVDACMNYQFCTVDAAGNLLVSAYFVSAYFYVSA